MIPDGGTRSPCKEVASPHEGRDPGCRRRVAVLVGVSRVSGGREVDAVRSGQVEEQTGPRLAADAAVLVPGSQEYLDAQAGDEAITE